MCSALAFYAWRRRPLICWKLLVGVACVYKTGLLLLFAHVALSAFSVELRPRGLRAVAFPRWLHVQSCSAWLILMVRHWLRRLVCTKRACWLLLPFAHVALLLLPLSLFLGVRAPSLCLGGFVFYAARVARCSLFHQLLCFGFVDANSNSMNSIRRAASSLLRLLRRCSCCESTHHRR